MSSLYIHIPFCHHKCLYCSFYSITQKVDKEKYVESLIKELLHRKDFIENDLQTIYFGGGTPSLLNVSQVEKILSYIEKTYNFTNVREITFEINAENADKNYLQSLKNVGINRLSIGIESFDDKDLRLLNRSHSSRQAISAIENAKTIGFENISIDLISNLPFSSFEKWKNNLQKAVMFDIQHISCYTLMIEEGTMLQKLIERGKYSPVSEQRALDELDYTMDFLEKHNFIHYETSSYAKQGFYSQHNMAYWTFEKYLGLGSGAHSYNKIVRQWNENDVFAYINRIENDDYNTFPTTETLSLKDKYNEYVMLSARMKSGIDAEFVQKNFPDYYEYLKKQSKLMQQQGLIDSHYNLTVKGWHLQDYYILNLAL